MNKTEHYPSRPRSELRQRPRMGTLTKGTKILLLVLLHIPLAFLVRSDQLFATLHALITLIIGVWIALTSEDIKKVIPVLAYIAGAEVLWRMTKANVFWEFGKYATAAILILAILRNRRLEKAGLPFLYFLLLLPSIFMTVNALNISGTTRNAISFNLSGPLAAFLAMVFFRQIKVNPQQLETWLWSAVYPIVSIFTLAAYNTLTATAIEFRTESIFITSGGFGPNQVSAILGLGAMLLILLAIDEENLSIRNGSLILALALLAQSTLTFSRGGVLNVLIAIPLATLHLRGDARKLSRGILIVLMIALAIYLLILPELDQFTGGALIVRYSDLDMTGRESIARADLDIFLRNPILGVGPGMSSVQRFYRPGTAAHTEYTRVLAEHGSAGLLSLLILLIALLLAYVKTPSAIAKAWVVALVAWPLLEMAHAAMRLVSISLLLGLALVQWESDDKDDRENQPNGHDKV